MEKRKKGVCKNILYAVHIFDISKIRLNYTNAVEMCVYSKRRMAKAAHEAIIIKKKSLVFKTLTAGKISRADKI